MLILDTTPRVRGLLIAARVVYGKARYNPACAGTTLAFISNNEDEPIQPRVCGDYRSQHDGQHASVDTTPRVRGLLPRTISVCVPPRYNPACAGTTGSLHHLRSMLLIQPRVCGDYRAEPQRVAGRGDTTPRVRGLLIRFDAQRDEHRYNPACAGTTAAIMTCSFFISIQPRVCGDYRLVPCTAHPFPDNNPACAGTTRLCHHIVPLSVIQPRVCGDYSFSFFSRSRSSDTTPRVRGLHGQLLCLVLRLRYNPACAGTTWCCHQHGHSPPIQPRVCGDYFI